RRPSILTASSTPASSGSPIRSARWRGHDAYRYQQYVDRDAHHPVMSILVVDVGTSSVRAAIVNGDARVVHEETRPLLPSSPAPGLVEFDPARLAATALDAALAALDTTGPVDAVGIADQRCST